MVKGIPRYTAFCLVVAMSIVLPRYLAGQEGENGQAAGETGEAEEVSEEIPLFERTMLQDVETAGISELTDWAVSLGLSSQGSRQEIEDRILDYYGVSRTELLEFRDRDDAGESVAGATPEGESNLSIASIRQARGSNYFTIEQTDERYLRLVGGVILTMEDDDSTHTITAEEITLNLEENTISAFGMVEYSVEGPDSSEEFRGDSIAFNIRDWDGVFLRGITDSGETIDEEDIDFSVAGERISRSPQDIVVIDDGVITSSQGDPPNYRIKARRIWILAPGEWGIRRAVLYVGRVPMFYFPYFFLPGDRLFFNPAIGSRSREGSFIQTTTYIFGQSEEDDPPFSIMQIAESPDDRERVIRGLFLTVPDEPKVVEHPNWSLKVMADVYTTLGYYGGVQGDLPGLGPFSQLDFRVGLGTSRNIYNENGTYSSFYVDEMGNAGRRWNYGYLMNRRVPYRYEASLDGVIDIESASFSFGLEHFSDTRFESDYYNRAESIDWGFLINQTEEDEETDEFGEINSLLWETIFRWNPSIPALRPWVTSIGFSSIRTELQWASRENAELPDPIDRIESDASPEERFFYPESAVFPDIAGQVRGTLFQIPRIEDAETDAEIEEETETTIRPPWEASEEGDIVQDERFRLPERAGDLPGIPPDETGSVALTYSIRPNLRIDRITDDEEWQGYEDVGFDWRYSTLQNRNRGDLNLNVGFPGGWITYNGVLSGEQRYQSVEFLTEIDEAEKESLNLAAFSFRGARFTQTSMTTGYPLRDVEPLSGSTLQHRLTSRVYDRSFEELDAEGNPSYKTQFGDWSEEGISTHTGTATVRWLLFDAEQSFSATAILPPLDRGYTGVATIRTGPVTSTFSGGYKETEEEGWKPDPFVQSHTVTIYEDDASVEQRLEYDLEETELVQSRSIVNLWPLRVELVGQRTNALEFVDGTGWVDTEKQGFYWTSLLVGVQGNPRFSVWKRRIDLGLNGLLSFEADLQEFTRSGLVLEYGFDMDIYRFLTLEFAARSTNDLVYQYVPSLANTVDRPRRDPLEDLINSLRLFDDEARRDSFFKIDSVEVTAVHDLQDWELSFSYIGGPELTSDNGVSSYQWQGVFAILFQWRAITEIRRDIRIEDGILDFVES